MQIYLLAFTIAFITVLYITPKIQRFAIKFNIVDNPSARKVHKKAIPLLGGLAIFAAFSICLLLIAQPFSQITQGIFLGGCLIILLGLWDDYLGLKPLKKFLGQVMIALIMIFIFNIHSTIFNGSDFNILDFILSLLWIVGITNSFNLLDNMDGLATGIAGIAATFFFILAFKRGQADLAIVMIILAGSCFGFLKYNFSPATIFMGDMGSMFLGLTLALAGITVQVRSLSEWVLSETLPIQNYQIFTGLIPLLILGIPIFDTTLVTILRILSGRKISEGGKDHSSHRLKSTRNALQRRLDKFIIGIIRLTHRNKPSQQHIVHGIAHSRAVLMLYASEIAFGFVALILTRANVWQATSLIILVIIVSFLAAAKLAKAAVYYVESRKPKVKSHKS
ncbi:MAG: undecaprenyl/decaprenyl-phosphate alpha-N-acetylglucosaminyl 1-phosphate transferase [Candidatus Margulisbacteria bacterium]|nr:undecaprenyl/decaprenyl-phosphate alpha-N-acetylglucosaminyl 1-phosphate transferase [Candidatus Margulisiibacteriota bacterium]